MHLVGFCYLLVDFLSTKFVISYFIIIIIIIFVQFASLIWRSGARCREQRGPKTHFLHRRGGRHPGRGHGQNETTGGRILLYLVCFWA